MDDKRHGFNERSAAHPEQQVLRARFFGIPLRADEPKAGGELVALQNFRA
jgi:hypothetical protein